MVNQVSASTAKSMADSSRAKTTAVTKPVAGLPLTSKMTNQPALGPYCLPLPTLQEGPAGNHAVRVAYGLYAVALGPPAAAGRRMPVFYIHFAAGLFPNGLWLEESVLYGGSWANQGA